MLRESADQKVTLNNCAFDFIWVRDRKGRLCAFLALYSVCMFVYTFPCQGRCRGSQCVVTAEEEDSAFVHVGESKCQPCGGGSLRILTAVRGQTEEQVALRWG